MCITTTRFTPNASKGVTHLVRNYSTPSEDCGENWRVDEVLLATSAFPSVCPALVKNGYVYRDGGLLANNPSLEGVIEVGKLWPQRSIGFVHSIGMGGTKSSDKALYEEKSSDALEVGSSSSEGSRESLSSSIGSIVESIAETGAAERHTKSILNMMHPEAAYRRIDLPLNHHGLFIKGKEEYKQIAAETADYLQESSAFQDLLKDHRSSAR